MADSNKHIRIDIVSDVVCPWCIIGYKQVERALQHTGISADVIWHPFELNPKMASEGEDLFEHVAAKYGTTREGSQEARAHLTKLGADLGFAFNYADDMRMVNTFRAHQLIFWADTKGQAHAMKMALFAAFFTHRRDLNDVTVLAACADALGLDGEEALAALKEERFAAKVRDAENFWLTRGIQGVPAMIFQQRYLASGAQGVENYTRILNEITEQQTA